MTKIQRLLKKYEPAMMIRWHRKDRIISIKNIPKDEKDMKFLNENLGTLFNVYFCEIMEELYKSYKVKK